MGHYWKLFHKQLLTECPTVIRKRKGLEELGSDLDSAINYFLGPMEVIFTSGQLSSSGSGTTPTLWISLFSKIHKHITCHTISSPSKSVILLNLVLPRLIWPYNYKLVFYRTHFGKYYCRYIFGLPCLLSGKESACQCRRCGFNLWVRKIPWRRNWQPTSVFFLGKSHGQRRLAGYSPLSHKRVRHNLVTK